MKKVRIGVIGVGNMGSGHANILTNGLIPNAELTALCDIAEARRTELKKQYPEIPVFVPKERVAYEI